jgi:heme-degrading monooxygenase HmoA
MTGHSPRLKTEEVSKMVTVISRFRVRNGLEGEVRRAFLNRPRLVEQTAGFRGLNVLTDAADPSVFLLLTRWTDEASFRTWHRSEAHLQSHGLIPDGLKLDASFTSLTVGNSIEDPAGMQYVSDAIEGQTMALSRWLMESDAVFALLLAPDGTIRERNPAGGRLFTSDPAKSLSLTVWDYLVSSDAEHLRQRLSESGDRQSGPLLLNLTDGQQNPITLEAGLVGCGESILMLGAQELRYDSRLQTEILTLTNDLSLMAREGARKSRELTKANETIGLLARTDALTGLANRRTLHEGLEREISRAERLGGP